MILIMPFLLMRERRSSAGNVITRRALVDVDVVVRNEGKGVMARRVTKRMMATVRSTYHLRVKGPSATGTMVLRCSGDKGRAVKICANIVSVFACRNPDNNDEILSGEKKEAFVCEV